MPDKRESIDDAAGDVDDDGMDASTATGSATSGTDATGNARAANASAGDGDASPDKGSVPFAIRWYAKARTWMATAPGRFREWASDDNPDKVDRDRKLAFLLTPVFLMIITGFVSTVVSYALLFFFMASGHLSYDDATGPASDLYNRYLGIPVALVGMALVMFSPAVRDVVRYNGGYHAGLKEKAFVADMKASNATQAVVRMMLVGVFGGMLAWIMHTLLVNGLVAMGFDDIAKASNTTENVIESGQQPAAISSTAGDAAVVSLAAGDAAVVSLTAGDAAAIGFSFPGAMSIAFSVLASPVIEELVYRGFISRSLVESTFLRDANGGRSAWMVALTCLVTGLWFGMGHITGADSLSKSVFLFCFMTCFGAFLTWLSCVRYRSVWPGVLVHVTYNAVSLVPVLFA